MSFTLKQKIIGAVIAVGVVLIAIFQMGFYRTDRQSTLAPEDKGTAESSEQADDGSPRIISTVPEKIDGEVLLPAQEIVIRFNMPLEGFDRNVHVIFEPKLEFEAQVSGDRKSVTIKPKVAYAAGRSYLLRLKDNIGFAGGKKLGSEKSYSFKTIEHRGI